MSSTQPTEDATATTPVPAVEVLSVVSDVVTTTNTTATPSITGKTTSTPPTTTITTAAGLVTTVTTGVPIITCMEKFVNINPTKIASTTLKTTKNKIQNKVNNVRYVETRRVGTCAFADRIALLSKQHYYTTIPKSFRINSSNGQQIQTCIATIIASIPIIEATSEIETKIDNNDPSEVDNTNNECTEQQQQQNQQQNHPKLNLVVLSMGVGTKFLTEETLQKEYNTNTSTSSSFNFDNDTKTTTTVDSNFNYYYGERVRDCHAEVLARRGFRRYLSESIQQLQQQQQQQQQQHAVVNESKNKLGNDVGNELFTIIEQCCVSNDSTIQCRKKDDQGDQHNNNINYKIKDGILFHMYCSSSPCGNSVIKKFATLTKEVYNTQLSEHQWTTTTPTTTKGITTNKSSTTAKTCTRTKNTVTNQQNQHHEYIPPHSIPLGQFSLLLKKDNSILSSSTNVNDNDKTIDKDTVTLIDEEFLLKRITSIKHLTQWPIYKSIDWCPSGTIPPWIQQKYKQRHQHDQQQQLGGSIHTCSDKIGRWNYLGLQGSLLSSLICVVDTGNDTNSIHPIYLTTITIGRKYNSHTCRRAICCRFGCHTPTIKNKKTSTRSNNSSKAGSSEQFAAIGQQQQHSDSTCKSIESESQSYYYMNHPVVMGTGVYLDESGIVDMSILPNRIEGQDVRFHSSKSWVTWLRQEQQYEYDDDKIIPVQMTVQQQQQQQQQSPIQQKDVKNCKQFTYEVECINGSTGYCENFSNCNSTSCTESTTNTTTKQISRISTRELTKIFLQIQNRINVQRKRSNSIDKTSCTVAKISKTQQSDDDNNNNNNNNNCSGIIECTQQQQQYDCPNVKNNSNDNDNSNTTNVAVPATLSELRRLKITVAEQYEQSKSTLLEKQPVFRYWRRRCDESWLINRK